MSRLIGQKIRNLREDVLGESQEIFGDRLGVEQATVSRWEAGNLPARRYQKAIADLASQTVSQFFFSEETPITIPVIGYVSAGESFTPVEDHEPGAGLDYVTPQIGSREVLAVIVRGDSMSPVYRSGDTIIGTRMGRRDLSNAIGKDCIVKTTDGEGYVKRVMPGTAKGLYRLRSYNALFDDIEDVKLEWAAPIIWINRS